MKSFALTSLSTVCRIAGVLAVGCSTVVLAHADGPTTVPPSTPTHPTTTYIFGNDPGATSDFTHSDSDQAQALFTTDASAIPATSQVLTFESLAVGSHTATAGSPVSLGDGVSVFTSNVDGDVQIDQSTNPRGADYNDDPITGYNVTAGGSKYLYVSSTVNTDPDSVTFDFAPGVQGFGSYFTGVGTADGMLSIDFSDGTTDTFDLSTAIGSGRGGLGFFGLLDPTKTISSLTLVKSAGTFGSSDVYSMDNIQIVRSTVTPEPDVFVTAGTLFTGIGSIMTVGRRRMRRKTMTA